MKRNINVATRAGPSIITEEDRFEGMIIGALHTTNSATNGVAAPIGGS